MLGELPTLHAADVALAIGGVIQDHKSISTRSISPWTEFVLFLVFAGMRMQSPRLPTDIYELKLMNRGRLDN